MKLDVLGGSMAVSKLGAAEALPDWATQGGFSSVSRTSEELSIVCEEARVPAEVRSERGWRLLKVRGPLDFNLTGVLASIAAPLAARQISLFAISTFDTDYLMVKEEDLEAASEALCGAGIRSVKLAFRVL